MGRIALGTAALGGTAEAGTVYFLSVALHSRLCLYWIAAKRNGLLDEALGHYTSDIFTSQILVDMS